MRKVLIVGALYVAFFCSVLATKGWPHDHNHPENDDWFRSLTNSRGGSCCDGTEAKRVEDVDWRDEEGGAYSVKINGVWVRFEKDQIVTATNRYGYAMYWDFHGVYTCFMPGTRV